jgi:hypothetical protein
MGNKMRFLLEYHEYINNVDTLSYIEDNNIFNEIKSHSKFGGLTLIEGLITTHPLSKSVDIIKKRFKELFLNIEEDGEIYIEGKFEKLEKYLPIFTNLGYFISKYTIDGDEWMREYTNETKPIALFLEPKYDIKIYPIPNILYHTSPKKFDNKISKIGFIPKTGNKLSNHPERIYLTDDLETAKLFGMDIKKTYNEDYSVYEIDTSNLNLNLYSDINLRDSGYYAISNIPKEYFRKII